MAVMPGARAQNDDPALIRTDAHHLQDPCWWSSLNLDAVILYSWAAPRFTPVAKAINEAGIRLMVCMDTCGVISRQSNPESWFRDMPLRLIHEGPWNAARMREVIKYGAECLLSRVAKARIKHYQCADIVTVPTPIGMEWVKNEARKLGGEDLAARFHYLPHPQASGFYYTGMGKERLVVSIARWEERDWGQKNPQLLIESYRRFLAARPDWRGMIIGSGALRLLERLRMAPVPRLELVDRIAPENVPDLMNKASIGFWASRWEGQQGTAAQALCCGCSVVSHRSPMMNCFSHYVSRDSGGIAFSANPDELAGVLTLEADAWDERKRDPNVISRSWAGEFHAVNVARRALGYLGLDGKDSTRLGVAR